MATERWNYKGHDPIQFRPYGPTAQEFFGAFGDDGFGVVGTETTINSGEYVSLDRIGNVSIRDLSVMGPFGPGSGPAAVVACGKVTSN